MCFGQNQPVIIIVLREAWEKMVSPEDVEYAKCQEELGEQLLGQFTQVERVIGEALYFLQYEKLAKA